MILIVGATHDDILYFDSVLANKREEVILNRYKISVGTIFNQEAIVVSELFTSILTSAVLSHIFDKYYVDLVFCVGKCISSTNDMKNGDIALSHRVIDANVDLSLFADVMMSQIPGFDRDFLVQSDIYDYTTKGLNKRSQIDYHKVTYLSSDNISYDMVEILKERKTMFGIEDDKIVIDQNAAGVALASTLRSIPFIIVKVVENRLDQQNNLDTYSLVLGRFIDLGKAIISTINDIGRTDILEGD